MVGRGERRDSALAGTVKYGFDGGSLAVWSSAQRLKLEPFEIFCVMACFVSVAIFFVLNY